MAIRVIITELYRHPATLIQPRKAFILCAFYLRGYPRVYQNKWVTGAAVRMYVKIKALSGIQPPQIAGSQWLGTVFKFFRANNGILIPAFVRNMIN
jgi:hypothetical protein